MCVAGHTAGSLVTDKCISRKGDGRVHAEFFHLLVVGGRQIEFPIG